MFQSKHALVSSHSTALGRPEVVHIEKQIVCNILLAVFRLEPNKKQNINILAHYNQDNAALKIP